MDYAIVKDGVVENIIVADEDFAASIGALPTYPGCDIGKRYYPHGYEPTEEELLQQQITDLDLATLENAQMATDLELMILGGATNHV